MTQSMNTKLATALFLWSAAHCPITNAASTDTETSPPATTVASKEEQAINMVKAELSKQSSMDATSFKIISAVEHTWPDSSLGCGKPNQMSAQVITNGYVVTIQTNKGTQVVHATDKYAVICERNIILRNHGNVGAPLKNLEDMIARARSDLANKMHTQPTLIRTLNFAPNEWPDTSMGCVVEGEAVEQKAIKGYRIALNYAGRTYVYHTDMTRVRACPPIEAQ